VPRIYGWEIVVHGCFGREGKFRRGVEHAGSNYLKVGLPAYLGEGDVIFNGWASGDGGELLTILVGCDGVVGAGERVGIDPLPNLEWEG